MARSKGWKACLNCGEDHQTSVDVDLQMWTKPQGKVCTNVLSIERLFPFYKDTCNRATECEIYE